MQATAQMASVVSSKVPARSRLILSVDMFPESNLVVAAARFELAHGRRLEPAELQQVVDAGLEEIEPHILADQIRQSLDSAPDLSAGYRSAAFWALGKHCDSGLLRFFRHHLAREIPRNMEVAYQIMIALDNLGEPVWPPGQCSRAVTDSAQNREAAARYLNECA